MYQNGKQYSGTFAGVKVTFTLHNFSEKVVERFNQKLVEEAMRNERLAGRSAVGTATSGGF
jgi:hypothetical protein